MLISVVIPTFNEAKHIRNTIDRIFNQTGPYEILVVDGGSTDATCDLLPHGITLIRTRKSRAAQMNAGAAHATGDVLLFLHADTLLPDQAFDYIRTAMSPPEVRGGCFRLRFDVDSPILRFYSRCTHLPWSRMVFGDRAIFVRRDAFESAGGFPDQPLFEDLDFYRALHRLPGRLAYLPYYVTTSARRFEKNGRVLQQLRNLILWILRNLRVPPSRLAQFYQ